MPDLVTAGGATVAPAHAGPSGGAGAVPRLRIAAGRSSANRSSELSPTLPEHVLRGLADRIELLLDAGPTSGGLESTVLDLTTQPPRLLRPGLVTIAELEALLGPIERGNSTPPDDEPLRSPGQLERHYAPRTPLEIAGASCIRVEELCRHGLRVGWLTHIDEPAAAVLRILLPAVPVSYSAQLYAALHRLDAAGLDRIIVERTADRRRLAGGPRPFAPCSERMKVRARAPARVSAIPSLALGL